MIASSQLSKRMTVQPERGAWMCPCIFAHFYASARACQTDTLEPWDKTERVIGINADEFSAKRGGEMADQILSPLCGWRQDRANHLTTAKTVQSSIASDHAIARAGCGQLAVLSQPPQQSTAVRSEVLAVQLNNCINILSAGGKNP